MTWSEIGWVIIALAAVLLIVFNVLFKRGLSYRVRAKPEVQSFLDQRVCSIERGSRSWTFLGDQFWSRTYPALGLHALSVYASLAKVENIADKGQVTAVGAGELALFARQVVQGSYQEGVSLGLDVSYSGPIKFSFLAGFLGEMGLNPPGSMSLFGNYSQVWALLAEAAMIKGAHTFVAAGSVTGQAAHFLNVRDLMIGEEVFMLPGLIEPSAPNRAGWVSEDILRILLMALLVIAAGLKMAGLL